MRRSIILWLFLAGAASAWSQPCGLEDTLYINSNSTHTFNFEVFNIYNDNLANPDQGICGIEIEFSHNYVEDVVLSVTSPGGQTVALIGPNSDDPVAFTNFTRWRITFVPDAVAPEPDPGFLPRWNNNQPNNWGVFGLYTGSYHPYQGSLEDFNTGPVNGAWTINVNNTPSAQIGAILGFRLLFCDERGLDCCFAAAGNLDTFDNILACEGDTSLALELPPDYSGTPPDTNQYGYTYLIGEDSILLAYDSIVNLTGFAPGLYQVCGLSYKRVDSDSFPAPDGQLTIDSLRRNLSGLEPLFCGELTDSCLWVRIVAPPDTTFLESSICEGDSVMVGDSTLAVSGIYNINLLSYAGCDSVVNYSLTVFPTEYTNLVDTICQGDSVVVGTTAYTTTGAYADTLQSSTSCDSIISLNLAVIPPAVVDTSLVLCLGDSFTVGDSILAATGNYSISLLSSQGCDSIVNVNLQVLEVTAEIAPADTIDCNGPVITLDGTGSAPVGSIAYNWLDTGGALLGNGSTLDVGVSGAYILEVTQSLNSVQCLSRDTVEVLADTIPPVADAGPADTLTCDITELSIGGPNTSAGPEFQYTWSSTGGNLIGGTTGPTALAGDAGTYRLIVTNTRNGCRDTSTAIILLDERTPVAVAGPDTTLTCTRTSLQLSGAGSSTGSGFIYDWRATNGAVPQDANTLSPTVTVAGDYRLLVTNIDNGCADSAIVSIPYDTLAPVVSIAEPGVLNCAQPAVQLLAEAPNAGPNPIIAWQPGPGGNIIGGANSLMPQVDAPGSYRLFVENARNGCRDSASVIVLENVNIVEADAGSGGELTCTVDTLLLNGSASTLGPDIVYSWSSSDGHFTGGSQGVAVSVDAPGAYQLVVRDTVTFCADTTIVNVTQDTVAPIADGGPDRILTCDSTLVTLDGSNSSTIGNFDYHWIALAAMDTLGGDTLTLTVSAPGLYLLAVTNTGNGCLDTSLVEVGMDTLPPAVAIAEPGELNCAEPSLILDASASDSGPGFSFFWNALEGGQITSGANTLMPAVNAAGRYELVVENDATGCRDSASVLVTDSSEPVQAMIAPPGALSCDSTLITLWASGSSAGPDILYQWSTADGNIAGDSTGASIAVDGAGTYRLIVRDTVTFCTDTAQTVVLIDTLPPTASATVAGELNCTALEVTLDGMGSDMGQNYAYRWSGPCMVSGQDSITAVADCPGAYYLEVENTANGCVAVDSVEVRQNEDAPVASAGGPYTLTCDSLQLTLGGNGSSQGPEFTYEWAGPGIIAGTNTLLPVINLPGQYTLTVRDTVNTCLSTATVTVEIDTIPPVAVAGEVDVLTCDSTVVQIGGFETSMGPEFRYAWATGGGQFAGPADGPFALVSRPGNYQLTVRNTTNGCEASSTTTVFEDDEPPFVEAGPDQELSCAAPQAWLDGSTSDSGALLDYEWAGPCLLSPPDSSRMLVDCPGTFYLSITNTASGCVGVDSVVVSRDNLLPVVILPDSIELSCLDGAALIDASASEGEFFQWFFDGQPVDFPTLTPQVDTAGLYTLVAANAAQGCADTASVVVVLDCAPQALIAAPDTLTCAVTSVVVDATASTTVGPIIYEWIEPGPSCIVSGQGTTELEVRCSGLYTLIVTNTAVGLSDTASVEVAANTAPPEADAGPSDTLTCDEPTAILDAGGSTRGTGIGYHWTKLDDEFFSRSGITAEVNDDGTYFLTVVDSLTGCFDEDIVVIERSAGLPDVAFGNRVIPCLQDSFWLQAFVEPPGQPYSYSWVGDNIIGGADSSAVLVDTTGVVTLTVVNTSDNCTTFRTLEIVEQVCIPCLEVGPVDSLTCLVDTVAITASFCEPCIGCTVQWSTQDGLILSNNDSLEVLAGAPGTYIITATDTLGFSEVLSIVVRENTLPPFVDAGPGRVLDCDTPEVALGASAVPDPRLAYQWLNADGNPLPQDTLPRLIVADTGAYQLRVTHRITGCSATDQAVVTRDTLAPYADAGEPVTLTCAAPSRTLDGSGSDFGPAITYAWSGPAEATIGGANSFNPTVSDTGWFVLTVTDTTNGCLAIDSVLVTREGEFPPAPMLSDTNLNCGASVILLMGSLPPEPGYTGRWCRLGPDGQPQGPCTDALVVDVALPGVYRFEVEDESNGCVSSVDVEVGEDYSPPVADAGPGGTLLCNQDSLRLQGQGGPAGAPLSFAWTALGGSPISGADSPQPFIFQADTFVLEVTNLANQCTALDSVVVRQDLNAPLANAGPDTSLTCSRVNVRLQGQGSAAGGSIQVRWTTPDGNIALDGNSLAPLVNAPGSYILEVASLQNGCVATDTVAVAADRNPPTAVLDTSGLQLDCRTDSILLDASASVAAGGGLLEFDWRRLPAVNIGGGPQVVVAATGAYRLLVTSLANGCKDTLSFSVNADYERPDAVIGQPAMLTCNRTMVTLDGNGSSAGPGFSYIWIGPAGDTLTDAGLQATATMPGTYDLIVADEGNGCFASAQQTVTADTLSPVASVREPEALDCIVRTVALDGSASSFGDFIQYFWSTTDGQLAGPADSNRALAAAPGWYTLLVTDLRNGCAAADSVLATELASPVDSLLATAFPPSCPGRTDGYIVVDSVLGGTGPFLFSIEGGSFAGRTRFEALAPGSYRLSVQDANGCESETGLEIPEAQSLAVGLGPDITLQLGMPDTLFAEITPAAYDSIWWWPIDSLGSSNSPFLPVNPAKTTTYFVWVSNGDGCTATDNIEVRVVREYPAFAPTAFSPNGDDNNDRFTLYAGADVARIRTFQIFDRWGDLVYENSDFQPNDPTLGWDGSLNGMPMDPAVFVFYAEVEFADGRVEIVEGDVVLMR